MATGIPDASSAVGLLYANSPGLSLHLSFVKTLRQEIEDDPAKPKYMVTEPWVGYRFCNPLDNPSDATPTYHTWLFALPIRAACKWPLPPANQERI